MAISTQYFYLDGEDSRNYGIYLSSAIKIGGAQPRMEKISIPGRNGDLLRYDGGFSNVSFSAECFVHDSHAADAIAAIAQWTAGIQRYRKLQFPWEDGYRMTYVISSPDMECLSKGVRAFTLDFSCAPQVFTYEGERVIKMTEGGSLYNQWMPSLPKITVYGSGAGSLTVGDVTVTLKNIDEYITLDSDIQDAFKGTANKNSTITAPEFPVLQSGDNTISWSGGVTSVEILPRWWHL